MKTNPFKIVVIFCLLLYACQPEVSDHPVFQYYPAEAIFNKGYVSKYYQHYYPNDQNRETGTEIFYTKCTRLDAHRFEIKRYNAGFDLEAVRTYAVQGDSVMLEHGISTGLYSPEDTTEMISPAKTIGMWTSEKVSPYQVQYSFDDQDYLYTEYQQSVYDSLIEGKPAKVFINSYDYKKIDQDTALDQGISTTIYMQGMGLFTTTSTGTNYTRQTELMEQMSVEEFEKRADHGQHRVAWIDPLASLSDDTGFELCGHERAIADYYNSDPDGRYIHSKRAMLDTIYTYLDKSRLYDQSGRLVFRFVVNCEGRAGRFIAEGYDMGYQKMAFRQETIDHLFGILQKLEEWRPVLIRGESRDAYFYITFNLENGEIINILP